MTFFIPGMNTPIEVGIMLMANDVQSPDKTTRPATTFIIIDDNMLVRREANAGKQRLKLVFTGQFSRYRWCAAHQFCWIDMYCPWHMNLGIGACLTDIDDKQVFIAQNCSEGVRFNDQV